MPLKQTLEHLRSEAQIDPTEIVNRWRAAVDALHKIIRADLREHIDGGLLRVEHRMVTRSEQTLGPYTVSELVLLAGPSTVILAPVATVLVGAHGRVDMYRQGYADNRAQLIWNGKGDTGRAWRIVTPNNLTNERPYSKQVLEEVLDTLLRQI
jgi:hypothetical protein